MPSALSTKAIAAANSAGKTSTVAKGRPFEAWLAERPSSAISVAVSKPRPNRKPSGGRGGGGAISANSGRERRARSPPPAGGASGAASPARTRRKVRQVERKITVLTIAIANRNSAETSVPTSPPSSRQSSNDGAATASSATASATTAEWP